MFSQNLLSVAFVAGLFDRVTNLKARIPTAWYVKREKARALCVQAKQKLSERVSGRNR